MRRDSKDGVEQPNGGEKGKSTAPPSEEKKDEDPSKSPAPPAEKDEKPGALEETQPVSMGGQSRRHMERMPRGCGSLVS